MSRVIDIVQKLIACASVTPQEKGSIDVLREVLEPAGFTFHVDPTPNGTTNAWITHGSGRPLFVFAGHVDVVPPGDLAAWHTPPFTPTIKDGILYGRGAADMKGSDAAAAAAFARFVTEHPEHRGTAALLITSDEEGDGMEGTKRVVAKLKNEGIEIDACIVGEPSCAKVFGDTIKNGRRGSLNCVARVLGRQGHVAYPQNATNAVHLAAPVIAELASRRWDEGDENFGPTGFQVSNIHAGTGATNVVPGVCEITFNFRYSPVWNVEKLQKAVAETFARHHCPVEFTWQDSAHPFITPAGSLTQVLTQAIAAETGVESSLSTSGGTSDARFICAISKEIVEFGPRNATIHSANECVAVGDLEKLERIYYRVLSHYLGQ